MVLCVNNDRHPTIMGNPPHTLNVGAIYCVTRVDEDREAGPLAWLQGVRESTHGGYCLWRFVPAGKRGDFAHHLLAKPVPADRVGVEA